VAGRSQAQVVAGMHRAFARRIAELVPRAGNVILMGGGARNPGLVRELETVLEMEVSVPSFPSFINAAGAIEYVEGTAL